MKSTGEYFVKESSEEINYICELSESDRIHQCNSMGTLAARNAYGTVFWRDEQYPNGIPVSCEHGGSMWLCVECAQKCLKENQTT